MDYYRKHVLLIFAAVTYCSSEYVGKSFRIIDKEYSYKFYMLGFVLPRTSLRSFCVRVPGTIALRELKWGKHERNIEKN